MINNLRKFGSYFTSNPWLNDYLTDAGITPIAQTFSVTGRRTWEYICTDDLRETVQQFRINQNDKEA